MDIETHRWEMGTPCSSEASPGLSGGRDPDSALAVERLLVLLRWEEGRMRCPHCGFRRCYRMENEAQARIRFKCARCRRQFSARAGTVLERSNLSAGEWIRAMTLFLSTPRGGMAARIHREVGMSYKTAWSVVERLRDHPEDPILTTVRACLESGRWPEVDPRAEAPAPVVSASGQ